MRVLITAALPYANGPLHLGHIRSTYLPADIYARYNRLIGNETLYICATDEHGTPIVLEAEKQGKTPKEITDYYHEKDKREFNQLGFSMDIFHRTSSKENAELTREFFLTLRKEGYIYKRVVKQYFCEELGRFMPDRYVKGKCPYCGAEDQYADQCEKCGRTLKPGELIEPYCTLTNTKPVLKEAEHYFFKLTAFRDRLEEFLEKGKFQKEVVHYVKNWLDELKDWDIVRNLDWGIPVPGEKDLVFYVWFDAPIGYISSLKALRKDWREWWESSTIVHFIGKDIIYHHYLFWPAMLMGVSYALPYAIPTRGHLTLEGKKFSKSRGWYITLEEFLNVFPADYLRYYMTSITPYSLGDANFSLDEFKEKINNELIATYGNLINRVGKLAKGLELTDGWKANIDEYHEAMRNFRFKTGLEKAMAIAKEGNRVLTEKEPWKLEGEERRKAISEAYYYAALSTVMLYPFIPFSAEKAAKMLGIEINFAFKLPAKGKEAKPLFKKVEEKEIEELRKVLRKRAVDVAVK